MRSTEQQLSRVDLNLLVSLSVLMQEQNVSRAAEKLFVSQPAMSRNLQKLRDLFDDPLFHRKGGKLHPTEKTIELQKPLSLLLTNLSYFIEGKDFDPLTCDKTFSISVPSTMSYSLILPFISKLAKIAPNIVISQHPSSVELEKSLTNGEFDFAINVNKLTGDAYQSVFLGSAHPGIFARNNHPLTQLKTVSIEDCLQYKFVEFNLDNHANLPINNPAMKYLKDNNLSLQVAMKSGQLGILTEIMQQTDHLLIGAHYLMDSINLKDEIVTVLEFEGKAYEVDIYLIDHERTHNSKAHAWLKSQLVESLQHSIKLAD